MLTAGWFYILRHDYKLGIYLLEKAVKKAKSKRFQPDTKRVRGASIFLSKVYARVTYPDIIIRDERKSSAYANIASAIARKKTVQSTQAPQVLSS